MNRILMFLAITMTSFNANAVIVGPSTDFENGTVSGWHIGSRGDGAVQVGVGSEGDNTYLRYTSTGIGQDSRVALMADTDYRGNFSQLGVNSIVTRMRNDGPVDLRMHVAFGNSLAGLRTRYATEGVDLVADGQWYDVTFSLTENLHMVSSGGHGKSSAKFSAEEVLANIVNLRFTHGVFGETYLERRGPFEGYNAGEEVEADLHIDDIQLSTLVSSSGASMAMAMAPVPVPAAVWLFASAIGGLAVSRKRSI